MASSDATPLPIKNQAYRVTFPILDADGDLVSGATSPDSEVSKDGGTFADCTNEATEIATSSGMYYLDLTATEMNADTVSIIIKSGTGKTTPIVLYPQTDGLDRTVDVTHWNGTAVATPTIAGVPEVDMTHLGGVAQSATDLKDFADDGYDPATNKVEGVKLADTTTTNTDLVSAAAVRAEMDSNSTQLAAIVADTARLSYAGPRGLGVFLDDAAANTNTVLGVDGIESNPVSTIAAATTLAGSLGSNRIYLVNDSAITLAQAYEGWEFAGIGLGNQINLGSQDVDNAAFYFMTVTGTQGGTGMVWLEDCSMTGLVSLECVACRCYLTGTNTVRASSFILFDQCKSAVAGSGTPELTFAGLVTNMNFRHYSGGLQINSMATGDIMSYESDGQIIVDATCTDGTLIVRGCLDVTDNSGGAVTITQSAAINASNIEDAVWDALLTGASHNIPTSAGRRLRGIQEFQGYENGAIWINTVNGTAGTTDYENGTVENPVDSIADANILAASLGMTRFQVLDGSSITFAASQAGDTFLGHTWTLALGGQVVNGLTVEGATVSGVMAGTGTTQVFDRCRVGTVSIIKGTRFLECGITGNHTMVEAGDVFYDRCHSEVAGTGSPSFSFGAAIGSSNLNIRNCSGGWQLEAMGDTGTDTASIEGRGQIIEGTCTGGTVAVRGDFETSGITNLTLVDDARYDVAQINAEVDAAIETYGLDHILAAAVAGADVADDSIAAKLVSASATADWDTFDNTTDSLEALGVSSGETQLRTGTAQAGAAGTITLDAGASATDDHYKHAILAITGGTGAEQGQIIDSYVGATKVATMAANWAVTPDATSTFTILPLGTIPGATAPTAAANAAAVHAFVYPDGRTFAISIEELVAAHRYKVEYDRTGPDIVIYDYNNVELFRRRITNVSNDIQAVIPQ